MTRLIRRIPPGEVFPGRAGAEHPEDAVEHIPRIAPRAATPIATHARLRQERFENGPLGVSQVHILRYDGPQDFVHNPAIGFMR
jgi:hypothetical protein